MNNQGDNNMTNFNHQSMLQFSSRQPMHFHNFLSMPNSTSLANHQVEEGRGSSFKNQLEQNMQEFWNDRRAEVYDPPSDGRSSHTLPLARIKKVMKSDEQVKMISADTPVVFAKACEMFIMELSQRAWMHTQENQRRTLQRNDVANAIRDENLLDFLKDVVPMETYHLHHQEDQLSNDNHHHHHHHHPGMYVPVPAARGNPTQPIYPMMNNNMQSMNQAEVAPEEVHPDHHRFAFPMNFSYNMNDDFLQ